MVSAVRSPLAFVALLWLAFFYGEAVAWLSFLRGPDEESTAALIVGQSILDGVSTLIWTAYMVRSGRVKATFRERYRPSVPVAEPAVGHIV